MGILINNKIAEKMVTLKTPCGKFEGIFKPNTDITIPVSEKEVLNSWERFCNTKLKDSMFKEFPTGGCWVAVEFQSFNNYSLGRFIEEKTFGFS